MKASLSDHYLNGKFYLHWVCYNYGLVLDEVDVYTYLPTS